MMIRSILYTALFAVLLTSCGQKTSPFVNELQSPPTIETAQMEIDLKNESETAHTMDFVSDASTTLRAWREFAEKEFKQKLSKSKGKYIAESVMVSKLSSGPISLYSNVEEMSEGSQLQVWVKSGEDFVSHSSSPEIAQRVDAAMKKFARQFYDKHYEMAIAFQQAEKNNVSEELSSIEKEKKRKTYLKTSQTTKKTLTTIRRKSMICRRRSMNLRKKMKA